VGFMRRRRHKNPSLFSQIWMFLSERKKWWLLPIVILLILVGLLLIFAQSSPLSAFIYALF
jgi:hypothetical protein